MSTASLSTASRRVSEFLGVALFAAALIWIVSLASYEPADPVWFFSTVARAVPANFAGRVGAFLAELSFQLFGYASYLVPAILSGKKKWTEWNPEERTLWPNRTRSSRLVPAGGPGRCSAGAESEFA